MCVCMYVHVLQLMERHYPKLAARCVCVCVCVTVCVCVSGGGVMHGTLIPRHHLLWMWGLCWIMRRAVWGWAHDTQTTTSHTGHAQTTSSHTGHAASPPSCTHPALMFTTLHCECILDYTTL